MSSLDQYAWSPRASLEMDDASRPVEANRAEEVLGLDLGPGSSQGSSSTRSSSLPSPPNFPTRRSFSRPQTRRGFLFGNLAVDSMGRDSSSSDLQAAGNGSGSGRFAIIASRLRRRVSPTRRHASPVRRQERPTGRRRSSMGSFSSATRTYAGDDDDWETVDNCRPVRRNMSFKVAGGSSIADISDYGSLTQSRQSASFSPRERLPQANYSENWSIMAEERTGRTILVSGSRMGITNVVPITPTSQRHPRYHHPLPLPRDHIHPFNSSPPIISPNISPSLPKSSSFVPSNYENYSPIFSDIGNSFPDRPTTMGSNLNVTGTPNGTGARLVGSSLANFSSPGFEISPLNRWPSSPPEENISYHARISSQEWEDALSISESPTVRRNLNYCTIGMDPQMRQSIYQKSLPPLPDELDTPEGTDLNIGNHRSSSSKSSSGFSRTFMAEDLTMRFPHLLAIDFESPNLSVFQPMPPSPSEERHERMKLMRSNKNLIAAGINNNAPEAVVADGLQISRVDPADANNHDIVATLNSLEIPHVNSTRTPKPDAVRQVLAADSPQISRADSADTGNHDTVATLHSAKISHVNSTLRPEFDTAHEQDVAADSLQISQIDPVHTSNHDTVATLNNVEISHDNSTRMPEIDANQQQCNANIPEPSFRHLPDRTVRVYSDHAAKILADIRSPMGRPIPSDRTPRRQAHMPTAIERSPHLYARLYTPNLSIQSRQIYLSRAWLLAFVLPFPMLIIMGHGMLDRLIEWQTNGEITTFRKHEKIVALGLGYGLTLVLVIIVVVWWVVKH